MQRDGDDPWHALQCAFQGQDAVDQGGAGVPPSLRECDGAADLDGPELPQLGRVRLAVDLLLDLVDSAPLDPTPQISIRAEEAADVVGL